MSGASVADLLPANCVFLIGKNQGCESSVLDVIERSGGGIKDADADGQLDVTKAERSTQRVSGSGLGILTRTVEIEEGNVRHIHNGVAKG
jgi:hypothetical protein